MKICVTDRDQISTACLEQLLSSLYDMCVSESVGGDLGTLTMGISELMYSKEKYFSSSTR